MGKWDEGKLPNCPVYSEIYELIKTERPMNNNQFLEKKEQISNGNIEIKKEQNKWELTGEMTRLRECIPIDRQ